MVIDDSGRGKHIPPEGHGSACPGEAPRISAAGIRQMRIADCDAVAQLTTELGYPSGAASIRSRIEALDDSDLVLVATDAADRAIGFIQAHRACPIEVGVRVEILALIVSSSARRIGVGRQLITEVERWAQRAGAEAVVVRSNTARRESHAFYPALAYELIKTQAVYEKKL